MFARYVGEERVERLHGIPGERSRRGCHAACQEWKVDDVLIGNGEIALRFVGIYIILEGIRNVCGTWF